MAMRDSRFGQFADPNFGASLSPAQPAQGVLPSPGAADTSASSDTSNGASTVGLPGLMGGHNTQGNPGSVYLAEGGAIPDDTQDSGNAAPANTDPFSMITSAMQAGRKKYGLPAQFFGGQDSGDAAPEPEPQAFAEGGEVEGEEDQGVIPDAPQGDQEGGDDPQTGQGNQQGAMAYLSGHGGVSPEVAQALEMRVDPQGQMDPSLRKMLAVTQAGDPDKAFQVMQHYRQKFNAFGAFAKAALQGSGGRPPNPAAAADALNKAYEHVPDGTSLQFRPTQGGMQVSSRNVMPGQNEQQAEPETQSFAEGGSVEDEDFNYETAGSQTPSGSSYDRAKQAEVAQDTYEPGDGFKGFADAITPKRDTNNATQNFILSIPALLGWTSKAGQFDSVMDKGADTTLAEAQQQSQQAPQQQPQTRGAPMAPAGDQGVTSQRPMDQGNANPMPQQQPPQQAAQTKKTPDDAKAFGAKVGTSGGEAGATLADVLHEIDQAYPMVGMAQQRALARAAARQHWADNRTKIESEQTKGANALDRAEVASGSRKAVANTNKDAKIEAVNLQQTGAGARNANTNDARRDIASSRETGVQGRFEQGEKGRNDRTIMQNKPGVIGNKDKMNEARSSLGGQEAPARKPGATQQQPTQGTGPAPTSVPPPGMKYQQNAAGTKWRLVPAQ